MNDKLRKGDTTSALVKIENQPFNLIHCKLLEITQEFVIVELIDVMFKGRWMEIDNDKIHRIDIKNFTALSEDKLKGMIGYDRKEGLKLYKHKR